MPSQAVACGWDRSGNFGDELAPFLVGQITGRRVIRIPYQDRRPKLLTIGSILHRADATATVWGSGLISPRHLPREPSARLLAVRGPLTRNLLRQRGHSVPEVYGDPALLLPRFYQPVPGPRYRLGIFPHYVDARHPWVREMAKRDGVTILSARQPRHDVRRTIDALCSCDAIASSSLHGLIVADAYRIPNVWIELTGRLVGRWFKFRDYAAAIGRPFIKPIRIRESVNTKTLLAHTSLPPDSPFDPLPLLSTFPADLRPEPPSHPPHALSPGGRHSAP